MFNMFDAFDEELDFGDDQFGLGVAKPTEERRLTSTEDSPVASTASIQIVEGSLFRDSQHSTLSARLIGARRSSTEQSQIIFDNFLQGEVEDAGDVEDESNALRARSVSPCRKRLFPGPAGILQTKSLDLNDHINHRRHPASKRGRWQFTPSNCENFKAPEGFANICSQSASNEVFESDLWTEMKRDLARQVNKYGGLDVLERFNIDDLLKRAKMNRLPNRKASSVLCVVLQFIDYRFTGKGARALFRDPSGEILGWLGCEIVKEYRSKLKPGCLIALKKPSVFSLSRQKHYLSVHSSNIMRIYVTSDDGTVERIEPSPSDVQASSTRTGSTSLISNDSGWSRIANVSAIDNDNDDSLVTSESLLARPILITGAERPENYRQMGNVVNRPRLSLVARCPKVGESTAAEAVVVTDTDTNLPRDDISKSEFQLEDDPFWNDDDFDSLLLSIGH